MNLFKRSVFAELKSKTFGNAIYFFDKEDVVAISHDGKLTYTVRKGYGSEGYRLITEIAPRKSITCDVGNLNNMFIIPEIEKRQDARLLKKVEDGNLCAKEFPETIFEIRDYGLLVKGLKHVMEIQKEKFLMPIILNPLALSCRKGNFISSYNKMASIRKECWSFFNHFNENHVY